MNQVLKSINPEGLNIFLILLLSDCSNTKAICTNFTVPYTAYSRQILEAY